MPPLRQSLLDTDLVRLRVIAAFWEISLTQSRHREVALELTEKMDNSEAIERARKALPDCQRRALRALLASDGCMPRRVFSRQWGEIRAMGPGRMERERPWEDPVSPAEGLWYRGFLFQSFEQGPDGAYEAVYVPAELRRHLPAPSAAVAAVTLEPIAAPSAIASSEDTLLDDACTLLSYVHNERPHLAPDHHWPERHRRRLLPRLHLQDKERFKFLHRVAFRIGWLHGNEGVPLRLNPEAATSWLQSGTFRQRCAMSEAWRDDPIWNDLFHVPALQPEDTGAWRNDPILARQAVLRHLRGCAPGSWYELDGFINAIKQVDPDFQRPAGDYSSWYIRDQETGAYLSGFESWDAVEGRLIRYLLTRPMAWLGLVDLGAQGSDQQAYAFRLGQGGAGFLGLVEPLPSSAPPRLRLLSGFRISVPADLRYERFQLSRVANWVRTGTPFVYRFTPASLQRARQQGIPIARVLEFVEEIAQSPLPRSTREALSRWETRGTEAMLERVVVLRLSDEELMNQVISAPRLAALIEERIGPTAALVRRQSWAQVVARLEDLGLLPQMTGLLEERKQEDGRDESRARHSSQDGEMD